MQAADFGQLRTLLGADQAWQFPEDNPRFAHQQLEWMRNDAPVSVDILHGEQRETQATLWVRGTGYDEVGLEGRVLMQHEDGVWRFQTSDFTTVD